MKNEVEKPERKEKSKMDSYLLKISVFGIKNVGKKTFAKSRFLEKLFDSDSMSTTGLEFATKTLVGNDIEAKLQLFLYNPDKRFWDRNKLNLEIVVRGSHGAVIMYDITKTNSLEQITQWVQIVKDNAGDIPIFLVGNKLDLEEQREVSKEQVERIKNEHDITSSMEISAKTGENGENMISELADMIVNHRKKINELDTKRNSFVRSINGAIKSEKERFEGRKNLKKLRKSWRRREAGETKSFEEYLNNKKEAIRKLVDFKKEIINAKELPDLISVWRKNKNLLPYYFSEYLI